MDEKNTLTLFGIDLGACGEITNIGISLVNYHDFKANEIGVSLGLIDSLVLCVDMVSGDIISYNNEDKSAPGVTLNHSISLCINTPVLGEIGE